MRKLMRSPWARPVVGTLAALGVWAAYTAFGAVHAGRILDEELLQAAETRGFVNVQVLLTVEPDQYNTTFLQELGSVTGVDGKALNLLGVTEDGLRDLAKQYWVHEVRAL